MYIIVVKVMIVGQTVSLLFKSIINQINPVNRAMYCFFPLSKLGVINVQKLRER